MKYLLAAFIASLVLWNAYLLYEQGGDVINIAVMGIATAYLFGKGVNKA